MLPGQAVFEALDEPGGNGRAGTRDLTPEVARQDRDVPAAAAQRRQLDAPHRETEEEVVAEAARLHLAVEVAPRRGDDAHVDAIPPFGADPLHLAALDGTQELGLEHRLELADLVDEERPAVGLLEDAAPLRERSRERAPLVTEERRLEQRRRDRGAVEHDERTGRARRPTRETPRRAPPCPCPSRPRRRSARRSARDGWQSA